MHVDRLIDSLERFADVFPAVVRRLRPDDARWRPDDGGWSILEIVAHLADEEIEDFRARLRLTLHDPEADWPPIDPEGWAIQRRYNEGGLDAALGRFVAARRESVAWLRGLQNPDYSQSHEHPRGRLSAGDLLTAWVAHDALHLRQIAKRLYQITGRDAGEFHADYAGQWGS